MSAAPESEPHSKRQRVKAENGESSSTIDLEGEEGASAPPTDEQSKWMQEEAKLARQSAAEYEKQRQLELKQLKKQSSSAKVDRLNHLLQKSIQYSEFLASKIKKEGEGSAVACKDGSVTGPALPQPALVTGGAMRGYQLVGMHWLVGLYENGLNGILGDEMGLGKTVQSIALLAHLRGMNVNGPFLVVGPLSTLFNWANEFKKWTPGLEAVVYHGSKEERARLRGTHWRSKNGTPPPVMITSYEIVMRDMKELRPLAWKFVIIDEGHRLKNMNCKLIRELKALCGGTECNRLLLSGTPLQNNLTELWSLLNFLLPDIFDDLDSFQAWFDFDFSKSDVDERVMKGELQHSVVSKLHQILRPFLLRRLKQDVEISLPPKSEFILFAALSEWQQTMYKEIINKQLCDSGGKEIRLNNVLMQLRKCCNHPYLFDWPIDEKTGNEAVNEVLILGSGKMMLLDRIMSRLREEGDHKVLIFSQMTRMLDILEDYLAFRNYTWRRLDGGMSAEDRMQGMHDFQSDEKIDVFLLSTRAGGLGVNLTAADTCIIFDSDWNPHADLQAQDRCHRIGQKKKVMVYRLATAGTVEEKVLHAAKQKLKLEQLVVSKGKFKDIGKKTDTSDRLKEQELADLLAFDPSKTALGKQNNVISDSELAVVLDRSGKTVKGKGFKVVEKTANAFDAVAKS